MLAVEVTDLYGSPRGLKLSARSITRLEDNEVVLSNVEFGTPDVKDNNLVDHPRFFKFSNKIKNKKISENKSWKYISKNTLKQ